MTSGQPSLWCPKPIRPVGGKPFSYINTFFFFQSMCMGAGHLSGNALLKILNIVAKLFQCLLRAVSQQTVILVTLI